MAKARQRIRLLTGVFGLSDKFLRAPAGRALLEVRAPQTPATVDWSPSVDGEQLLNGTTAVRSLFQRGACKRILG